VQAPEAAEVTAFHEAGHVVARMVRAAPSTQMIETLEDVTRLTHRPTGTGARCPSPTCQALGVGL